MDTNVKRGNIYVVGISHLCADAETLGRYGVPGDSATALESSVLSSVRISEALILSTCNRVEIYLVSDSDNCAQAAAEAFAKAAATDGDAEAFKRAAYIKKNGDAICHIFEVASGLQSQMTGETEILGQVKAAYSRSYLAGHCSTVLNTVFQKANQCAKWVRTNTDIGHGKISLGSVASELADRIFNDVSKAKILLIGSGEAGRLVADALFVRGAKNITVSSRRREHAETLAAQIGGRAADMDESAERMHAFDIVITASFSPVPLIDAKRAKRAAAERAGKPLFLIDLAVPRNVEPACSNIEDVYLYDLEDLSKIANENIAMRKAEISTARKSIFEKAGAVADRLGFTLP